MVETLKTVPPSKPLKDAAMSAIEPKLLEKLKRLSPEKACRGRGLRGFSGK